MQEDNKRLWQSVLGELEVSVSRANFSTWFRHTSILSCEAGQVIIGVPNIFTKNWLEKKYHGDIKTALIKASGPVNQVTYKIQATPATEASPSKGAKSKPAAERSDQTTLPTAPAAASNLNERYLFDSFVVGSSNELAYAASQAVAKYPGQKYNPLFIYGPTGLGKTHLMQSIGNEILRRDPTKRIEYVTSESFTNEFISGIMKKKPGAFVDKYRNVDVLIIDDIQFLAKAEKTQDEFFHTFNALHQANKQIIISSDKPPQALMGLEERLRSRFAQGMIADIQPPDLETRAAILQRKARANGITLDLDVTNYLARHSRNNIRELEGSLTQLLAFCELRSLTPSVATATTLLGSATATQARVRQMSAKVVIDRTAEYFDLSPDDLTGPRRDKDIVVPRQISMYLLRHDLGLSFPKIAQALGGRDHTTAMHSVTKIDGQIERDELLRSNVQAIREQLQLA